MSAGLLRDQALQQVPASVTVLNQDALVGGGQQHFEDVLAQVPNLNWARWHLAAALLPDPGHRRA